MDEPLKVAALLLSAAAAGAVNAVAGGGTLITFPTLVWLGLPPFVANASSTTGLMIGFGGGIWGYRREIAKVRGWLPWLLPSSVLGGGLGALLLVLWPSTFERIVPWLVALATALFVLQEPISRRMRGLEHHGVSLTARVVVVAAQLLIAIYGGYFGAGIGILMLAAYGLLRLDSIHEVNALKTVCGTVLNGVATALFISRGAVHWPSVVVMVVGATIGGYLGADSARKLGQRTIRVIVIAIGVVTTVALAVRNAR